jgi:hypothetical protein
MVPKDGRRPGLVCRAVAGQGHFGYHRHTAPTTWCESPWPIPEEVDFILDESARYLRRAPDGARHPQYLGGPASPGQATG